MTSPSHVTKTIMQTEANFKVDKIPSPSYYYIAIANCDYNFTAKGTIHLLDLPLNDNGKNFNKEFDWS